MQMPESSQLNFALQLNTIRQYYLYLLIEI